MYLYMKNFQTRYGKRTVRLLCLSLFLLFTAYGFAQSGKSSTQLKKDKQKIENEIAQTQKLLKKTESNQKAAVQQAALLRQQIQNREKIITNLNSQIIQMEDEQEQNQQEISQLEKKLSYMKADYAQVVYNAYRNRRLMDKVTFILAADDFSQMFRRLRYYAIFSRNVREQAERITKTTEELTKKKSICTSRSFNGMISDKDALRTNIANYASRCAEKLRKQNTVASIVGVFVSSNPFREDLLQYWKYDEKQLITPTSSTIPIVKAAAEVLDKIYMQGVQYKRGGVIVMGISPNSPIQQDLFDINAEQIEKF